MTTLLESLRGVPKHIPIIADAKRGDIGNTARMYAKALFDICKFDAATELRGAAARAPSPSSTTRTAASSSGAAPPTRRRRHPGSALADGRVLYEAVAQQAREWNVHGNVGLVMGATWPEQIERVRDLCPDMLMLLPGIGSGGRPMPRCRRQWTRRAARASRQRVA